MESSLFPKPTINLIQFLLKNKILLRNFVSSIASKKGIIIYCTANTLVLEIYHTKTRVPASHRFRYVFYEVPKPIPPIGFRYKKEVFPLKNTLVIKTCPRCDGKGGWYEYVEREVCERDEKGEEHCKTITETKWVTCPLCEGEGKIAEWVNEVYEWKPKSYESLKYPNYLVKLPSKSQLMEAPIIYEDYNENGITEYKPSIEDLYSSLKLDVRYIHALHKLVTEADEEIMKKLSNNTVRMKKTFYILPLTCIDMLIFNPIGGVKIMRYCEIKFKDSIRSYCSKARRMPYQRTLEELISKTMYILIIVLFSIALIFLGIICAAILSTLLLILRYILISLVTRKRKYIVPHTVIFMGDENGLIAKIYGYTLLTLCSIPRTSFVSFDSNAPLDLIFNITESLERDYRYKSHIIDIHIGKELRLLLVYLPPDSTLRNDIIDNLRYLKPPLLISLHDINGNYQLVRLNEILNQRNIIDSLSINKGYEIGTRIYKLILEKLKKKV